MKTFKQLLKELSQSPGYGGNNPQQDLHHIVVDKNNPKKIWGNHPYSSQLAIEDAAINYKHAHGTLPVKSPFELKQGKPEVSNYLSHHGHGKLHDIRYNNNDVAELNSPHEIIKRERPSRRKTTVRIKVANGNSYHINDISSYKEENGNPDVGETLDVNHHSVSVHKNVHPNNSSELHLTHEDGTIWGQGHSKDSAENDAHNSMERYNRHCSHLNLEQEPAHFDNTETHQVHSDHVNYVKSLMSGDDDLIDVHGDHLNSHLNRPLYIKNALIRVKK